MTNLHANQQSSDCRVGLKLSKTTFSPHTSSHLAVRDQEMCHGCVLRPCISVCPAGVYTYCEALGLIVAYQKCLECGSCKIVCEFDNIDWNYPPGGFGVDYMQG
jgi:ferredoxin like protein